MLPVPHPLESLQNTSKMGCELTHTQTNAAIVDRRECGAESHIKLAPFQHTVLAQTLPWSLCVSHQPVLTAPTTDSGAGGA